MSECEWELTEYEPERQKPRPGAKLSQVDRLFIRMMAAGQRGVLTVDLFTGQHCAKYTSRLSDGRLKQGHQYDCEKAVELAGNISTEQHRYRYREFTGQRDLLKPEVLQALEAWEREELALEGIFNERNEVGISLAP